MCDDKIGGYLDESAIVVDTKNPVGSSSMNDNDLRQLGWQALEEKH